MFPRVKPLLLIAAIFGVLLLPASPSGASPIKAKAILVEGEVTVFSITDSKSHTVVIGTKFHEGDRVTTGKNGIVEIEFDTGDLIRVDKSTDMVIRALHRNKKGSTTSIFSLLVGRVKSAVTKLVDKDSRFEYHTRAAIAGVAGTPPFIVGFIGGVANIDLLGKKGDHGSVFVKGTDSAASKVNIFPGFRTTVNVGFAPQNAFKISPQRRNQFNRTIPFINKPKKTAFKAQSTGQTPPKNQDDKPGDTTGTGGGDNKPGGDTTDPPPGAPPAGLRPPTTVDESMVINTINRNVSKPKQTSPGDAQGMEAVESSSTASQGIIGQSSESSGDDKPPVNTTTIDIFIKLK